jgi:urease accessory protein
MSIDPVRTRAATLLLADGRFPAGGHAQSAGVEAAVRVGDVRDVVTLERYLHGRLATTGIVEATFAAAACGADLTTLDLLAAELDARLIAPRAREISRRMGRQMLRAARAAWPSDHLDHLAAMPGGPHQPIVLGVTVGASGGDARDAATLAVHHLAAAVTSSAIRLLALDPIAVLALQAQVLPTIERLATEATDRSTDAPADLPAIGGALTEILAQDHASWDARLFVA